MSCPCFFFTHHIPFLACLFSGVSSANKQQEMRWGKKGTSPIDAVKFLHSCFCADLSHTHTQKKKDSKAFFFSLTDALCVHSFPPPQPLPFDPFPHSPFAHRLTRVCSVFFTQYRTHPPCLRRVPCHVCDSCHPPVSRGRGGPPAPGRGHRRRPHRPPRCCRACAPRAPPRRPAHAQRQPQPLLRLQPQSCFSSVCLSLSPLPLFKNTTLGRPL